MGFIKRAYLAVTKRLSKTFLMLAILFVIGTMIMAGLAIKKATNAAMVLARQNLGATVTISYDTQKAMQNSSSTTSTSGSQRRFAFTATPVTESWLTNIIVLDNVKSYNYYVNGTANASGFTAVTENVSENTSTTTSNRFGGSPDIPSNSNFSKMFGDITIKGVVTTETETSSMTLVQGRNLTIADKGTNNIIIEKNLLDSNGLALGDKISLTSASKTDVTKEFTIVGVYTANNVDTMRPTQSYNTVYIPYDVASADYRRSSVDPTTSAVTYTEGIDSVVLYLNDPAQLDSTITAITALGTIDTSKYQIVSNDEAYQQMIKPLQNVSQFATNSILVIILAGVVILALVLMLFIRERIYEVGVLLSLGESKFKINSQFVIEVVMIGVIAFSLSIFSGLYLSKQISTKLIQNEVTTLTTSTQNSNTLGRGQSSTRFGDFGGAINNVFGSNVQYVTDINIGISPDEIVLLFGSGLLIILLGVTIPVMVVSRYSPRKILSNQD